MPSGIYVTDLLSRALSAVVNTKQVKFQRVTGAKQTVLSRAQLPSLNKTPAEEVVITLQLDTMSGIYVTDLLSRALARSSIKASEVSASLTGAKNLLKSQSFPISLNHFRWIEMRQNRMLTQAVFYGICVV